MIDRPPLPLLPSTAGQRLLRLLATFPGLVRPTFTAASMSRQRVDVDVVVVGAGSGDRSVLMASLASRCRQPVALQAASAHPPPPRH